MKSKIISKSAGLFKGYPFRFSSRKTEYCFPSGDLTNFRKTYLDDPSRLFIDKSIYAASMMFEKKSLIYFNHPRRFGKSTFFSFLQYLYLNGLDSQELKNRFPNLSIFDEAILNNPATVALKAKMDVFLERKKKNQLKFITISLDFANLSQPALFGTFSKSLSLFILNEIKNSIQNLTKDSPLHQCLSDIVRDNEDDLVHWNDLFSDLKSLNHLNAKLVFLIDECDSPLTALMLGKKLESLENEYNNFFGSLKSLAKEDCFEKAIVTGVGAVQHLENNAFENFTKKEFYAKAFGLAQNDVVFLDWTNQRRAFYQNYIQELEFTGRFIDKFFENNGKIQIPDDVDEKIEITPKTQNYEEEKPKSQKIEDFIIQERSSLQDFLKDLEKYFKIMLVKCYD